MTTEHPWVKLCELAMCSPDFDVVHRFDREQACEWLRDRLAREGIVRAFTLADIEDAYDQWTEHLRQARGIDVGTVRLD